VTTPPILGDVPTISKSDKGELAAKTTTLALENRPKKWSQLVGQPIPVTVLTNSIKLGDIKPGYVFDGITGCGKSSAAYLVAKRLNCDNPDLVAQDPCGDCRSCRTIDKGTSPDVKFVDGASDRSVAFVRETLKPFLSTAPMGKYRVAIIDEAHLYGKDAISAFLTLLENMPRFTGKSVVILTTTESEKMDPAVMNRCMNLHFASIPNDMLAEQMAAYTGEDVAALRILAEEAGNSFRSMWSYIEVWQHLGEPLTEAVVMKLIGGVSLAERHRLWGDLTSGKVDKIGERWRGWLQGGARASVVGALLLRDLIGVAAKCPDRTTWHDPMRLLAGAQQQGSDSAWLPALYLMVGLPLDVQVSHRQEPAEGQPHLSQPTVRHPAGRLSPPEGTPAVAGVGLTRTNNTVEIAPVHDRLLFFGA
jgi:DNA polymerase III subunit gamma/tau